MHTELSGVISIGGRRTGNHAFRLNVVSEAVLHARTVLHAFLYVRICIAAIRTYRHAGPCGVLSETKRAGGWTGRVADPIVPIIVRSGRTHLNT